LGGGGWERERKTVPHRLPAEERTNISRERSGKQSTRPHVGGGGRKKTKNGSRGKSQPKRRTRNEDVSVAKKIKKLNVDPVEKGAPQDAKPSKRKKLKEKGRTEDLKKRLDSNDGGKKAKKSGASCVC